MGGNVSSQSLTICKKHLSAICGPVEVHIGDSFWVNLANTPLQLSSLDPKHVQTVMEPYCQQMLVNSRKTHNLETLIGRILSVIYQLSDAEQQRTAANGVCLLKFFLKSMLEKLTGPDFLSFIDGRSSGGSLLYDRRPDPDGLLARLVKGLLNVVIDGMKDGYAHVLLVEAMECLMVGCSTQLYVESVSWSPGTHPVLEILIEQRKQAAPVVQNLIRWCLERPAPPSGVKIYQTPTEDAPSVFKYVRKAAASVLWLPVTAFKYLVGATDGKTFSPLADSAQHLLFVLVHHVPYNASADNPFRCALRQLHDATYLGGIESGPADNNSEAPSVSFADLYIHLSRSLNDERGTLLLYTVIQCAHAFGDYALVRSDVETLMLPILKQVYEAPSGSQNQLYLLSIILLIFSQDTSFSQKVHKIRITMPDWYKERPMRLVSLGSFIIVLLLRMAHTNLLSSRDLYLHTNTMAALANIMSSAIKLDTYAAKRFMDLVDLLSRRYKKVLASQRETTGKDIEFRAQFYNDFLQMMLEVLNGVVTIKPENNPNLIYAILQRQTLLDDITLINADYAELVQNIQTLSEYFNAKIDDAKSVSPSTMWSVQQVLEVVEQSAPLWTSLKSISTRSTLRFSYEEEQSAEQFFVPVVWTLVVTFSALPWNTESVSLFSPQTPTASAFDSEDIATDTATSAGFNESHEV